MKFIDKIQKVIDNNIDLLMPEFILVPSKGATDKMINDAEKQLSRRLSDQHKFLLKKWNGIELDYIKIFGVFKTESFNIGHIFELVDKNKEYKEFVDEVGEQTILFADDASGFMYFENKNGSIFYYDPDYHKIKKIANDMDHFFDECVFGEKSEEYFGWIEELKANNIL